MRIDWLPFVIRQFSRLSLDLVKSRPHVRRQRPRPNLHLETLEDRSLLSGSNLLGGLINLGPIGLPDTFTVLQNTPLNTVTSVLANDTDPNGDLLQAQVVLGPLHGILDLHLDGTFSYIPNLDFIGTDVFSYIPNDGTLTGLIPTVVTLDVLPLSNTPPTANNDTFNLQEDSILNISLGTFLDGVLANDTDPDLLGVALTANLVTTTQNGSLLFLPTGTFIYTPDPNFSGTDTFTYQASDLLSLSNVATVTFVVGGVNDAPSAANDSYSTAINTTLTVSAANGVLANDSDIDSANLTAVIAAQPAHGAVTLNANGSFVYTPTNGFSGTDTFTYRANDGSLNSNLATVTITVAGTSNTPPVANNDNYTVTEDIPFTTLLANGVLANDTDANGDPLTAAVVSPPSHGVLVFASNGTFVYTPNANFSGTDSFTYRASDSLSQSNVATVTLTISGINDPPVALIDSYATETNTALVVSAANGVLANDLDLDSPTLTAAVVTQPTNGTLTLNPDGSFTYTPDNNFVGVDIFTYRANDGSANSVATAVTITVLGAANTAPVANNDTYTLNEDSTFTATLANGVLSNDTDADNDTLTAQLISQPSHGTVTLGSNGTFVYTPNPNYSGSDSFTYQANDGTANSNVATVALTITGANDAPIAGNDSYSATANSVLTVSAANGVIANDSDPEGSALTATVVDQPLVGTLTLNPNGSFTYTPNAGFVGTDIFTYRVSDGTTNSNLASVTITVSGEPNAAPVATNDTYANLAEDTPFATVVANGVLANDTDANGDTLTAIIVAQPSHGSVVLAANGTFVYTPNLNYNGTDTFTYQANDGTANSNVATVILTIGATNDAPTATPDAYSTDEDVPLVVSAPGVLANDNDPEGSTLTAVLVASPTHGTLTFNANGSFTYTPNANYTGADNFTYRASDGTLNGNIVTVSLTVNGSNDPPTSVNDAYTVVEGAVLNVPAGGGVLANDSDADGDPMTVTITTQPTHGSVVLSADGSFVYTPAADFSGTDTFGYSANDGTSTGTAALVTITVTGVNDAPTSVNDAYSVNEEGVLTVVAASGVLANDTDLDGDTLTAVLVSSPTHGTLALNANGSFTYTPSANFSGTDTFTYRSNDGTTNGNVATVTLTVNGSNDLPVAANDTYTVAINTTLTVPVGGGVLSNDTDADGNPLTATIGVLPTNGTVTLAANGSFSYTPNTNFIGTDSFTYTANDGTGSSNTASVTITVTNGGVNNLPVSANDAYSVNEDGVLTVALGSGVLANDVDIDGNPLTAVLAVGPTHGTLTLNPNGSFSYTPNANFSGSDSFTYRANDGTANGNLATVTLTINGSNDLPVSVNDSYTVAAGGSLTVQAANGVLANDTDADGNALTATITAFPTNGTVQLAVNGAFVYTPNANFTGTDTFTYMASDGTGSSGPATVTITVTGSGNTNPVAVNDTYSINTNGVLTVNAGSGVLANDTDANGDTLSATITSFPTHGTLQLAANGSFVYTPTANFSGTDTFTYTASDGTGSSAPGLVTITIGGSSGNTAPVSTNDTYTINEDGVLTLNAAAGVLANDTDADGNPLTAAVVTPPAHGTLVLNPDGSLTYTPASDFNGADTFTYRANDGTVDGNLATVTFNVNPQNEAPVVTTSSGRQTAKGRKRIVVDPAINVTDADSTSFTGGSMDVAVQSGAGGKDTLSYRHGGANRGRVNSRRDQLRVGKVVIGTITGGKFGTPLHVEFNSNATVERVKLAMQNLTFRGTKATAGPRVISFKVKDDTGLFSNVATKGIDVT